MIYCFLVDVSAPLNEEHNYRFSYIDLAKAFVESVFLATKNHGGVHYMLLTAESSFKCLKTSLGESTSNFESAIKQLQIINKYRIKNSVECYGEGMKPWVVDPVNFYLLSNKVHPLELRKHKHAGLDLTFESYRWDHKLYAVLVDTSSGSGKSIEVQDPLVGGESDELTTLSLVARMGGDALLVHSFRQIHAAVMSLLPRFATPSLLLSMGLHDAASKKTLFKLVLNAAQQYSYPIPEAYLVDANTEHLSTRSAIPSLTVLHRKDYVSQAIDFFNDAISLKIRRETYIVDFADKTGVDTNKSVLEHLGLLPQLKYLVSVANADRSSDQSFVPFAILTCNANATLLSVLPYNFPRLIPQLEALRAAQLTNKPISSQITSDLVSYFKSAPIYCQPSILSLFQLYGLHSYMPPIAGYNRFLVRRIHKMKKAASDELVSLENSFRDRIKEPVIEAHMLALGAVVPLPRRASEVRASDLLSTWERMRQAVLGGPGLAVQGLSVAGVEGVGGSAAATDRAAGDWIGRAVGGLAINQISISNMSKYEERLAVKEALRDPYDTAPPEDENEPSGILRRKLSVSFGSKFRAVEGKQSLDSIQETLDVFADTPSIYRDDSDGEESGQASVARVEQVMPVASAQQASVLYTNGMTSTAFVIGRLTGGTRKRVLDSRPLLDEPSAKTQRALALTVENDDDDYRPLVSSPQSSSPRSTSDGEGSCSPVLAQQALTSEDRALPEGWIKAFSNKQNKAYWYNVNTKKSVWEFPLK